MREAFRPGQFIWHELIVEDTQRAASFYLQLTGWKTHSYLPKGSNLPYITWYDAQGPLGALLTLDEETRRRGNFPRWFANVMVEDIEAVIERALAGGATLQVAPAPMGTVGRWAILNDAMGARFALFQPKDPLFARNPLTDGGFTWNEHRSSDPEAAFAFYRSLFGWEDFGRADSQNGESLQLFGMYGQILGGFGGLVPGVIDAPAWVYYAEVTSLHDSLALVAASGGQVCASPRRWLGAGNAALVLDPGGALLGLRERSAPPLS